MSGKGSAVRPYVKESFDLNYDRIFNNKSKGVYPLKEAESLIDDRSTKFWHLYDTLVNRDPDWEEELLKQKEVVSLNRKLASVEAALGITVKESHISILNTFYSWLDEKKASIIVNYSRVIPEDLLKAVHNEKQEIREEIEKLEGEIELLKENNSIELND